MISWISLLPPAPSELPSAEAFAALDVSAWPGERDRLIALQWQAVAARTWLPRNERKPEILELTATPLRWKSGDLAWALRVAYECEVSHDGRVYHLPAAIAEQIPADQLAPFVPVLTAVLADISTEWEMPAEIRRPLAERYGRALARLGGELPAHILPVFDDFGAAARRRLGDATADPGVIAALEFATTLTKPVPSPAWRRRAAVLVGASPLVPAAVREVLGTFVDLAVWMLPEQDALVRGLCWMSPGDATDLIARVAVVAAAPGDSASRTAVAAVEILADRGGDVAARALGRLLGTARSKPLLVRVRDALDRLGAGLDLPIDDHGLDRSWPTGDGRTLTVEIVGEKATVRAWQDGRPLKTVPAGPSAPKALVKEVNKTLAAERARVEGLLSVDHAWEWEIWAERYLRHPITGTIARRLIWQASADRSTWVTGLPVDGSIGGLSGAPCVVRLWHPALAEAAEVAAWRDRIGALELRQPFKQAYREVYRLTPAEEATRVYSNRFAGHILRYRQANALMRARGWAASFLGPWDGGSESTATKELAAGQWRASFRHELAGEVVEPHFRVEHCSTDQVRFARRAGRAWEQAAIADVPPRVLNEAMRDIDLFVGVTSIAADDTWADRGEHGFREYWHTAGFGELTGSAEVRRDVLTRLLPRLKIGARCELTDRFLRVRGTRAIYKIHLGSATILMEPDDRYLCIVPGGKAARVSLPFDDDERLSLILSKAFLLAADDTITDPTILRQLSSEEDRWLRP